MHGTQPDRCAFGRSLRATIKFTQHLPQQYQERKRLTAWSHADLRDIQQVDHPCGPSTAPCRRFLGSLLVRGGPRSAAKHAHRVRVLRLKCMRTKAVIPITGQMETTFCENTGRLRTTHSGHKGHVLHASVVRVLEAASCRMGRKNWRQGKREKAAQHACLSLH